jgi:hypothetical protein
MFLIIEYKKHAIVKASSFRITTSYILGTSSHASTSGELIIFIKNSKLNLPFI